MSFAPDSMNFRAWDDVVHGNYAGNLPTRTRAPTSDGLAHVNPTAPAFQAMDGLLRRGEAEGRKGRKGHRDLHPCDFFALVCFHMRTQRDAGCVRLVAPKNRIRTRSEYTGEEEGWPEGRDAVGDVGA